MGLTLRVDKPLSSFRNGVKNSKSNLRTGEKSNLNLNEGKVDFVKTIKNQLINDKLKIYFQSKNKKDGLLVLFLVDSSGSMAQKKQINLAKGVVESTLKKYLEKKVRFSIVSLRHGDAFIDCESSHNKTKILNDLAGLSTGGKTNMVKGMLMVSSVVQKYWTKQRKGLTHLFIFTDGKINVGAPDPMGATIECFGHYLKKLIDYVEVIDTDCNFVKLEMANKLAKGIGAEYKSIKHYVK